MIVHVSVSHSEGGSFGLFIYSQPFYTTHDQLLHNQPPPPFYFLFVKMKDVTVREAGTQAGAQIQFYAEKEFVNKKEELNVTQQAR